MLCLVVVPTRLMPPTRHPAARLVNWWFPQRSGRQACRIDPLRPTHWHNLGEVYMRAGNQRLASRHRNEWYSLSKQLLY